jgi:hypothetical protein
VKLILWMVVLFGGLYCFAHAYFLLKDKNKLGAVGIILIGVVICACPFFIRLK